MKREDRAKDPAPAGDFNREDQPATSDPFVCERCDEPLGPNLRFCSRTCMEEWVREDRELAKAKPMTLDEMKADMEAVFARLASYDEEGTS